MSLKFLSWNVLADAPNRFRGIEPETVQKRLTDDSTGNIDDIWAGFDAKSRREKAIKMIQAADPDIICLQECDSFEEWERMMSGYQGIFVCSKDMTPKFGIATFWKKGSFNEVHTTDVKWKPDVGKDVRQMIEKLKIESSIGTNHVITDYPKYERPGNAQLGARPFRLPEPKTCGLIVRLSHVKNGKTHHVIVGNSHLEFSPNVPYIKLRQFLFVKAHMEKMVSELNNEKNVDVTLLMGMDMNVMEWTPLGHYIAHGQVEGVLLPERYDSLFETLDFFDGIAVQNMYQTLKYKHNKSLALLPQINKMSKFMGSDPSVEKMDRTILGSFVETPDNTLTKAVFTIVIEEYNEMTKDFAKYRVRLDEMDGLTEIDHKSNTLIEKMIHRYKCTMGAVSYCGAVDVILSGQYTNTESEDVPLQTDGALVTVYSDPLHVRNLSLQDKKEPSKFNSKFKFLPTERYPSDHLMQCAIVEYK